MIDALLVQLKNEQVEDDGKKQYCETKFDELDDKKKGLEQDEADLETAIEDAKESISTLKVEIEALDDGIKALDKEVADATETRKEEHEDFVETLSGNTAAVDLLNFAKNRLNKFYNPSQYTAPPKRQLSEDEQITLNMGGTLAPTAAPGGIAGTGIGLLQGDAAPPPPPAADLALWLQQQLQEELREQGLAYFREMQLLPHHQQLTWHIRPKVRSLLVSFV